MVEVLEPGGHRGDRQPVGVEVVGAAGHLQTAQVGEVWTVDETGGARGRDDSHVESGVVGDEGISGGEGDQVGELFAPERGALHIRGHDAVDAGVPLTERVVSQRGVDEPVGRVDDFTAPHLHHADRARRSAVGVGGFEVDRGEVEAHHRIVSCAPDRVLRHALPGPNGSQVPAATFLVSSTRASTCCLGSSASQATDIGSSWGSASGIVVMPGSTRFAVDSGTSPKARPSEMR